MVSSEKATKTIIVVILIAAFAPFWSHYLYESDSTPSLKVHSTSSETFSDFEIVVQRKYDYRETESWLVNQSDQAALLQTRGDYRGIELGKNLVAQLTSTSLDLSQSTSMTLAMNSEANPNFLQAYAFFPPQSGSKGFLANALSSSPKSFSLQLTPESDPNQLLQQLPTSISNEDGSQKLGFFHENPNFSSLLTPETQISCSQTHKTTLQTTLSNLKTALPDMHPQVNALCQSLSQRLQGGLQCENLSKPTKISSKIPKKSSSKRSKPTISVKTPLESNQIAFSSTDESSHLFIIQSQRTLVIVDGGASDLLSIVEECVSRGVIDRVVVLMTHFHDDHVQGLGDMIRGVAVDVRVYFWKQVELQFVGWLAVNLDGLVDEEGMVIFEYGVFDSAGDFGEEGLMVDFYSACQMPAEPAYALRHYIPSVAFAVQPVGQHRGLLFSGDYNPPAWSSEPLSADMLESYWNQMLQSWKNIAPQTIDKNNFVIHMFMEQGHFPYDTYLDAMQNYLASTDLPSKVVIWFDHQKTATGYTVIKVSLEEIEKALLDSDESFRIVSKYAI